VTIHRALTPRGWRRGRGYSHGIEADGRLVFVAGQVGWNQDEAFESDDFVAQFLQALVNTKAVLAEASAGPEHVVRMTWYVVDKREYLSRLEEVGATYREQMGRSYPAMAVVEVKGLIEDRARIEIETTAVVPRA
jgi:enamine deaminase RidA (YjgF/YER057c/UK114 family)